MSQTTKPGSQAGDGGSVFSRASKDIKRLRYAAQDALRSAKELERVVGDSLGTYDIAPGETLDADDVVTFLRIALEGTSRSGATIHVVVHQS